MGKEFLKINGNIKDKLIRVTGNIQLLQKYLEENKDKLSASEIEHLNYRIKVMGEVNKLSENNLKEIHDRKALIAPVERQDGTIELVHIHQDNLQNTWNGCWSVSLQLLLQSRGIRLTQEQIRAFRPDITNAKDADGLKNEEMLNEDKKAIMDQKVDLVMKLLPNTSVNTLTISNSGANMDNNLETAKKLITKALKEDCSPVSIVKDGHFRTIVGINGDEVLLKDSIQFRTHGANHTYKISLRELISGTKDNLSLYWLHDLSVEKDGKCREFNGLDGISYKDGKIDYKESVKIAKGQIHSRKRGLVAEYMKHDSASLETEFFRVEDSNLENSLGGYGGYGMHLPKNVVSTEPRKIRKFTEVEIELIDKLKEREILEDIQMRLNTPDENGYYPAMTEKDLQDLNTAYQSVSDMYTKILNDKKTKITKKQKDYLQELKGRTDREKEILPQIQKNADGVFPTYREALRQVERTKAAGKTPYQIKEQSLQNLQEKFAKIDKKSHSNSKEYTEMLRTAKQLQVVLEAVSNPEKWKTIGIERVPNEREIHFLLKKAEDAALKAVDTYIKEKGNPFTEFGKNRLAAAKDLRAELKQGIHLFQEEKIDDMMKEQARLKSEFLKIKPPFSSEELKTLRDKFEPETPMYDAGSKAMVALDMLGGMKYRMDQSKIEPDKKRMKDSILKVMAFTILGGREITDSEKQNMFSAQYYNAVIEGLENANVFEGRSQEEWFYILEKKEGVPTLKQVCAEFKEGRLLFAKQNMQIYKGVIEGFQFLDEVAQAKIDLAEIDYNNLKDGPEREKLEDALSKLTAQLLVNNEIIKDGKKQNGDAQKIHNMNPDVKKELLQRIKETNTFKKAVEFIANGKNMKEKFLLDHEKFMKDMVKEIEKKNPNISKDFSIPEKNDMEEIKTEMTDEGQELV